MKNKRSTNLIGSLGRTWKKLAWKIVFINFMNHLQISVFCWNLSLWGLRIEFEGPGKLWAAWQTAIAATLRRLHHNSSLNWIPIDSSTSRFIFLLRRNHPISLMTLRRFPLLWPIISFLKKFVANGQQREYIVSSRLSRSHYGVGSISAKLG